MEVSSQDPSLMAMDLSKSYKPLTHSHTEAIDLAKKPEWYHRRPPGCTADITSSYRSRASSSFNPLSTQPGAPMHCRDMEPASEALGNYMNSTLTPGLNLYHDRVHGNLWHQGFYKPDQSGCPVPESSGGEESDSGSDVIFLVSSAKEPLLCSPFIQDGVRHIVEPLSPAVSSLDEGRGCYHLPQPLSSPSPDSSYSEDSSDSSVDIPVHHTRPVVLLSDLGAVFPADDTSDDSDVIEVSVTNDKKQSLNFPYEKNTSCTESVGRQTPPQSEGEKTFPKEVRRSNRIRKSLSDTPQFAFGVSRHSLRRQAKNDAVGIYNEICDSDDVMEFAVRSSSPEADDSVSQPNVSQRVSSNSDESNVEAPTDRKSAPTDRKSPPTAPQPRRKALHAKCARRQTPPAVHKTKSRAKQKQKLKDSPPPDQKSSSSRSRSGNKKMVTRRKRKRRTQTGPSALFSPREPEIMLKYAKLKEREKKDKKCEGFYPFVHMERRMCTVVNFQDEEASVRSSQGGQQRAAAMSLSGFVPSTSCFQLGRLGLETRCPSALSCCLCGQTANAMGLGDLHGPYYPAVSPLNGQSCRAEQREEEEDSHGLANSHSLNSSDGGGDGRNCSPAVSCSPDGDSESLPKLPLRMDECWIHEDCGIWSASIFLVRGKLYGLEEAARLAQEAVCSTCHQTGAIMGCFQKGCPRNYHYRCAIQSGCALNEENFSMRCTEHKNKAFTSVTRHHKR